MCEMSSMSVSVEQSMKAQGISPSVPLPLLVAFPFVPVAWSVLSMPLLPEAFVPLCPPPTPLALESFASVDMATLVGERD